MYDKQKTNSSGSYPLGRCYKTTGAYHYDAARMLGVSRKALSEFVNEKAMLSPDMAIRIAKATNTSPESWMNMQQKLTLWGSDNNSIFQRNVIPFRSYGSEEAAALQM